MSLLRAGPEAQRALKTVELACDLAVVGGGLAGTCCAITAARAGSKVVLVQDRPVLGGNGSSEVRLWSLGATSHMGNNNRWAREGGVIDEIMVENTYRNPEGNPLLFDTVLLERVRAERNITLLLNTAVFEVTKRDADTIAGVRGFCSQNSTLYTVAAPLFCDASGDGVVGFLAGAAFRMGAETKEEFGEGFAPDREYGELLGHTIYFYSKNVGRPVSFTPPSYALQDITKIPRFGQIAASDSGCAFWWLEYGGRRDTVHDTEEIKWELWSVVYGIWNYIKNSGKFPEAANLTLEWVGQVPGKRESRRFEGDYLMVQQDLIEQRTHPDAVSFGGWAIDLHPADGVYSDKPACTQWHSKGVYQIPYRSLYSRNITNLFLGGRLASVSHVAFGSTRVMCTCAHSGQAIGLAAALCVQQGVAPRALSAGPRLAELQRRLVAEGQYIPGVEPADPSDRASAATVTASSSFQLARLPPSGQTRALQQALAMLVPAAAGPLPRFGLRVDVKAATEVTVELRTAARAGNFTPDRTLATRTLRVGPGREQELAVDFGVSLPAPAYVFVCLLPVAGVQVHLSEQRVTGVLALQQGANRKVAKKAVQEPPAGIGVDTFEFWIPERRPGGQNLALTCDPPLALFGPAQVTRGPARPTTQPNAWVAAVDDPAPTLTLDWDQPQTLTRIVLSFDTDFDHAMESVQWGHPERAMPFCVKSYVLRSGDGSVLAEVTDNHQTRNVITLSRPISTQRLTLTCRATHGAPAAVFRVACYGV